MPIRVRSFNTPFSEKLNCFAEDETLGFESNHFRFMIFLEDLNQKIDEINQKTRDELQKEDPEYAHYALSRPDINAQINYFSNMLIGGFVVSMYSYLENQTDIIYKLSKDSELWRKVNWTPNNSKTLGKSNFATKVKCIYNWMLQKDFAERHISVNLHELLSWTIVRHALAHEAGQARDIDPTFLSRNGITITNKHFSISQEGALRLNELIFKFLSEIVEEINAKHGLVTRVTVGS